jgi:hypothetical protein
MTPEERVEYLNGQLFDARRLLDESRATTQKWYDEAHEKRRELRRLEEQLETLRRHDEAATQDAIFFRKGMVDAQEQLVVADQLAEWVRVTCSVEGVFSNNIGAQAQAQGLSNLLTRYVAARASSPAKKQEAT